jgi:hypothetical protein
VQEVARARPAPAAAAVDGHLIGPALQATAALVFPAYAARTADRALSAAFADLADRLAETALKTAGPAA